MHFERALFIVGKQNSGKSSQIRSIFLDWRFGLKGRIATDRKVKEVYRLSNDRFLYVRLTSPHEFNETLQDYLEKCDEKMSRSAQSARWNHVCPLQPVPVAGQRLRLRAVEVVERFIQKFSPERTRVLMLSPGQSENGVRGSAVVQFFDEVERVRRSNKNSIVEAAVIDARSRGANGLFLGDYFDFT